MDQPATRTRKVTLKLSTDDFRLLERHVGLVQQTKQEFLNAALRPFLDLLRIEEARRAAG